MKRVGVIGAGPMGRLHVENVQRLFERGMGASVARVFDRNQGRAESLAQRAGARAAPTLEALFDAVDLVVVATPTRSHSRLAAAALDRGLDVLVEKPLALTVNEGRALVEKAQAGRRILQVGHLEWFNARWRRASEEAAGWHRLEVDRVQPASRRGRDIDVIQDLMLHDLDWTSRLIASPIVRIEAAGRCVEKQRLDEARAEIVFETGEQVGLFASRVHSDRRREARFIGEDGMIRVQLDAEEESTTEDPLTIQWAEFLESVRTRRPPANSGSVGVAALEMIDRVREVIDTKPEEVRRGDDPDFRG